MTWSVVPLREVADVVRGVTYKKEQARDRVTTGHVPLVRATNIGDSLDLTNGLIYVPEEIVKDSQRLQRGDIVLASSSGSLSVVGKSAPLRDTWDGTFGAFCAVIRSSPRVDASYLSLYLRSHFVRSRWSEAARGTNINNLKRGDLDNTPIPVPSLDEQRQIVDLLEDHLSRLDAANSYLAAADCRAGLLWAAGLSDLILPPEARELLSAEPAALGHESPPAAKLPAGWRWARWADVGTSENGKPFPSRDYQDTGIRLLRPGNLGPQGVLTWRDANTRFMPNSYRSSHPTSILQPGDLVMNLTAQSLKDDFLGRVCLVREGEESLLNQRIARLRSSGLESGFALAVLRSRLFRHYVKSLSTGSLIQHMFTSQLNRFWIPVPPATEQRRIARAADIMQADIARQVEVIRLQGQRSPLLRRSLLAAAFSGRLTGSLVACR